VVVSLLLAAGLIVFVNKTENFKVSMAAQSAQLTRAQSLLQSETAATAAQASYADAARRDRDTAVADGQKALAAAETEVANAKSALADAQGNTKVLQVSIDNLTAAVNASEAQRKALADLLDSTRTDNNTLNGKNNQLNLAINDLTARVERLQRLVTDYQETIASDKSTIEEQQKRLTDAGVDLNRPAGTAAGAPSINAVVRSSQMINGIPYATISVGSNDQVIKGMKFNLVDNGTFLGEITIEQVDEKEATGKLEGPKISDVKVGTEAKTQL
jgi:DNA repair exonuclease SbcCD ATPase subunit